MTPIHSLDKYRITLKLSRHNTEVCLFYVRFAVSRFERITLRLEHKKNLTHWKNLVSFCRFFFFLPLWFVSFRWRHCVTKRLFLFVAMKQNVTRYDNCIRHLSFFTGDIKIRCIWCSPLLQKLRFCIAVFEICRKRGPGSE